MSFLFSSFGRKFLTVLLTVFVLIHLPFLNHPLTFDEAGYSSGPSEISQTLNSFTMFDGYKPPLSVYPVALVARVLGPTSVAPAARLYVLLAAVVSLIYIYRLGSALMGERAGSIAAVLLCLFPLFFIQSFLYSDAVFVTAGCLASLYYVHRKQLKLWSIALTLLLLTKETMILFAMLQYAVWIPRLYKTFRRNTFTQYLFLFFPLVLFGCWLFGNKFFFGWYLYPDHFALAARGVQFMRIDASQIIELVDIIAPHYLFDFHTGPLLIIIASGYVYSLGWTKIRTIVWQPVAVLMTSTFVLYFVLYFLFGLNERYMLFAYAMLIALCAAIVRIAVPEKIHFWLTACFILGYGLYQIITGSIRPFDYPESTYTLFAYRIAHPSVLSTAKKQYPDAVMVSRWPWHLYWEYPAAGYDIHKGDILWCNQWDDAEYVKCMTTQKKNGQTFLLIDTCDTVSCELDGVTELLYEHSIPYAVVEMHPSFGLFPPKKYYRFVTL